VDKEKRVIMPIERTFVMIKPEGIQRCHVGEILERIERKGMKLIAIKMLKCPLELTEKLYEVHKGKEFYQRLIDLLILGPVIAMVVEGEEAIAATRKLIGSTDPKEGRPGEIRFDYCQEMPANIIHAADSRQRAEFEINLFFTERELVEYRKIDEDWLFRKS